MYVMISLLPNLNDNNNDTSSNEKHGDNVSGLLITSKTFQKVLIVSVFPNWRSVISCCACASNSQQEREERDTTNVTIVTVCCVVFILCIGNLSFSMSITLLLCRKKMHKKPAGRSFSFQTRVASFSDFS